MAAGHTANRIAAKNYFAIAAPRSRGMAINLANILRDFRAKR
jgi:hypothetical protein